MIFRVSLSMSSEFQFRLVYHPNSIWQHSNCPSFNCNYVFFSTFCNTLFALYFWILLFSTVPLWYSGKSETQHTLPSNQLFSQLTKKTISWIRRQFLRQYSLLQLGENTEFRFSLCFSEGTQSPYIYLH